MQHLSRVSALYRSALSRAQATLTAEAEAAAAQVAPPPAAPSGAAKKKEEARAAHLAHLAALNSALHLAATLYLPADGEGAAVVGEELLHWVNCADPGESRREKE